jgi:uncharacterized phiE125 gp8 family phage protein
MPHTVTTPPDIEPVTVDELKQELRIDDTSMDALLARHITAAREAVERLTRRALITQTITATFPAWPYNDDGALSLPVGNVLEVSTVKYWDENNAQQTVSEDDYFYLSGQPGGVQFGESFQFPSVYPRRDAIEIVFTAGFGESASSVPMMLKVAILQYAAYNVSEALPVNVGNIVNEMPLKFRTLVNSYRVIMSEP